MAKQYRKLFPGMIQGWRKAWGQGDFPFLFVQIAPWNYGLIKEWPREGAALVREAQFKALATPNTAMVLATSEAVRRTSPDAFPPLHRRLFRAHFVDGLDLGDEGVVDALADRCGADVDAVRAWRADGRAEAAVAEARIAATEVGVTATPAFRFDTGLVITGVHPRDSLARWVTRMRART